MLHQSKAAAAARCRCRYHGRTRLVRLFQRTPGKRTGRARHGALLGWRAKQFNSAPSTRSRPPQYRAIHSRARSPPFPRASFFSAAGARRRKAQVSQPVVRGIEDSYSGSGEALFRESSVRSQRFWLPASLQDPPHRPRSFTYRGDRGPSWLYHYGGRQKCRQAERPERHKRDSGTSRKKKQRGGRTRAAARKK